jgi:hypothetical protein
MRSFLRLHGFVGQPPGGGWVRRPRSSRRLWGFLGRRVWARAHSVAGLVLADLVLADLVLAGLVLAEIATVSDPCGTKGVPGVEERGREFLRNQCPCLR